jgi:hypothetical protein
VRLVTNTEVRGQRQGSPPFSCGGQSNQYPGPCKSVARLWEARLDRLDQTALHRDEADLEKNKATGFQQGTEIAVDQFVKHVIAMK